MWGWLNAHITEDLGDHIVPVLLRATQLKWTWSWSEESLLREREIDGEILITRERGSKR